MRFLFSLLVLGAMAFGGWYAWENFQPFREFVEEKFNKSEFSTLEIRHTAEELMAAHRESLLKKSGYSYLEPKLVYHPYLMMDVKYTKDNGHTGEGILLWDLMGGEMVLNAETWDLTHGFEDCILAKANKNDFKIMKALVECGGAIDRENLYRKFKVDSDVLDSWIENCRSKKLIATTGNKFRLHFQNPHLEIKPVTKLEESLVTHPAKYSNRAKGHYSATQIRKLTALAFGKDFAIRKTQEVFLPVYSICVQNPDGSVLTTYWNALNGKQFESQS